MTYPADVLQAFLAHAASSHPREACGVVLRDPGGSLSFRPMQNVADRPDAYRFDLCEQLEVFRGNAQVVAIAHSHCDAGAFFSARDREEALGAGDEPLFPGVEYLVASIRKGPGGLRAGDLRAFRFDAGRFSERLLVPSG